MAGLHSFTDSNNLHHHKIRLRITRRTLINLSHFPLELKKLNHHHIFPTALMLHAASSIGRVMQPKRQELEHKGK
jgi:hypothetical protein